MKVSSLFKVVFDFIMLALLVAVYCAQPIGLPFHEFSGLVIYSFFIIHLLYNYKWIINVTKKLFDNSFSMRIKFSYVIDLFLLISFVLMGLSGIMMSRIIFKFNVMTLWLPIHSIIAMLSIVLLVIHIGLHGQMIINIVKTKVKIPISILKIISIIVIVILLGIGIYGDIALKTQSAQSNQLNPRLKYKTVLTIFEKSINALTDPVKFTESRIAAVRGRKFQGSVAQTIDISIVMVSIANHIAFIILCSILVYLIDKKVNKKK